MKFRRKSRTKTWLILVLLVAILIVGLIAGFKLNSLFNNQDAGIQTS